MKQNSRKQGIRSLDFLGRAREPEPIPLCGDSKIEIVGNRAVTIERCHCVVEYGDAKITLNIGRGNITFCGSDLEIISMLDGVVMLQGILASVEFSL